jgi:hypothetical protein
VIREDWSQAKLFLREHLNGHHSWREERRIARRVRLPALPSRRRAQRDEVWAVGVVHNEVDVILLCIGHLLDQGVDHVLVLDHRSSDGTRERLAELSSDDARVHLGYDDGPGHYQKEKVGLLARHAARAGASWVVPFDADEFWFARGRSLAEYLRRQETGIVAAETTNMVPVTAFGRDVEVVAGPPGASPDKVAFRAHRLVLLASGNHAAARVGGIVDGLHIAHLPYRSPAQLLAKFAEGTRALDASSAPAFEGWHWRVGLERAASDPGALWARIEAGEPVAEIGWSGLGRRVRCRPLLWGTWDPDDVLEEAPAPTQG